MEPFVIEPAVPGTLIVTPDVMHMAVAAYLARFKGQSRVHAESDLRSYLTWCTDHDLPPLAAKRGACRALRAVDAGRPAVQVLDRLAPGLDRGRLLPHLCHRRTPRALTSRPRPPTTDLQRVPDPGPDPPAVRGDPDRGPRLDQQLRLRPGRHARPPRAPDLRGHRRQHRRPRRGARPPGPAGPRQGRQARPDTTATGGRPRHRTRQRETATTARSCSTDAPTVWTATAPPAGYATSP